MAAPAAGGPAPGSSCALTRRAAVAGVLAVAAAGLLRPHVVVAAERVADAGAQEKVATTPSGLRWYGVKAVASSFELSRNVPFSN